ncbi:UDP-GlcNAc:betaGal beta-1,3-N-acetylglucosaminyltransferase-like protein 1 [Tribolium castaneum]|uniref:UDP-GlcNAc:betaGal beta-1,3-N-acetylglucosaminyltransferase-like protein 1 n=1 Tax=Tribolium castaneum TaxID=7070 RepID=D6WFJ2_TRICA|nr:PREDICTED: UDP-GlcNAc:betaGal beta-1,3-N-acetylglucosaminyltransferase-like protein 1 [Tribolium castaneum]EEZ99809.1 UDP-GlcNAc:betaGal beta-1,3-N-acetylglucosaminyltransferase-like protein 1 [Tribolium castaneum]|eukprot:XP_966540.2 PREDICTED: UDP-GlcNAc:betaGal beta-1,3-N-acetylglucosaminyltransferase-like protein 1 [Tribolium castaneum]
MDSHSHVLISVIVPIYNGAPWIDPCFKAVLQQELPDDVNLEVCVCNDASDDGTVALLHNWVDIFIKKKITLKVFHNDLGKPRGVGYSKNRAVGISSGAYLCFQDIDDVMLPNRIREQYEKARNLPHDTIIGSQFKRVPENSTSRYTQWANSLPDEKLHIQVYTSHGPTVIMPTWFCHRSVFEKIGGFSEEGKGTPEDLIFFYKHLDLGGKVYRVNKCLLVYTYHPSATTFSVMEDTIWRLRLERLENVVLRNWQKFTIWNAGKQGRKLYNSLSEDSLKKVIALCDVDIKKVGKTYTPFNSDTRKSGRSVDIVHFKNAEPPFVICVKINLTNGEFENNLSSLHLTENIDYVLFS